MFVGTVKLLLDVAMQVDIFDNDSIHEGMEMKKETIEDIKTEIIIGETIILLVILIILILIGFNLT